MDINSLQGSAAYANAVSAISPVGNAITRDQNVEASQAALDTETTSAAQEAFEVSITQAAQDRLAEETRTQEASERDDAEREAQQNRDAQAAPPGRNSSPIVNIVA